MWIKELKPRALCIDNIYASVRLIKTPLGLFWSLFLEIMQIKWSLWKNAYAMFEVSEDPKKKKMWHVATEKIILGSVLFY